MKPEKKAELMLKAKGKSSVEFLDNLEALFLETDPDRAAEELEEDLAAFGVDVKASWERTKRLLAKYGIYPAGRQMKYIIVADCLKCQHPALFPMYFDGNQVERKVVLEGELNLPEGIMPPGWCPLPDLPVIQEQITPGDTLRFQLWIVDAESPESVEVECWQCNESLGSEGIHDFVEHCDYHVECAIELGHWPDYGDIPF